MIQQTFEIPEKRTKKPTIRELVLNRYKTITEREFNVYRALVAPICESEGCLQDTPRREFDNLRESGEIDCSLISGIGKKSWYRKNKEER